MLLTRKSDNTKEYIIGVTVNKEGVTQQEYDQLKAQLLELLTFDNSDYAEFQIVGLLLMD